jgi:hypothetical protein
MCGEVVEDVDEGRVGGVGAGDLCGGEIYVRKSEFGGSEGGGCKEACVLGGR